MFLLSTVRIFRARDHKHQNNMPHTLHDAWHKYLVRKASAKAGNPEADCRCCGCTRTMSLAQWMEHFISQCKGSKDEELFVKAQAAAAVYLKNIADKKTKQAARDSAGKTQRSIVKLNQKELQKEADAAVARMIFSNGLPLRLVDDYFFREALQKVAAAGPAIKPLNRKRLTDECIPAEVKRIKADQKSVAKLTNSLFGQSLVSDGWTDATGKPLINVLLISPNGEEFIKAVDTSGNIKNMQYIADLVGKHVTKDVDFVVMDGANAGAIEILTTEYPWVSGVVCTTHSLDLLMKDLGGMAFAADPLNDAKTLVQFIMNHQKPRAMFMQLSEVVLLSPCNTRFGHKFIMVERLLRCEESVRSLFGSRQFSEWVKAQEPKVREVCK
jgi:hypothetical protein